MWRRRWRNVCGVVACSLLVIGSRGALAEDPPGAYVAPSPEPTAAETLMLEYLNRARLYPAGDIPRCLRTEGIAPDVDREMFATEMQGFPNNIPPIFFDLNLLKAARWHSYYMGFNEMEHSEAEGETGFTGGSPSARCRAAGFSGGTIGENIIKSGRDPWWQHMMFMVDWGEGPGGMQPGRGHRANNLSSAYRLVGIGAVEHPQGGNFAVTVDFGGSRQRYAGGVVYRDNDRDQFYDIGEGVGGVFLSQDENEVQSWQSGAYTLPIGTEEGWVYVELDGHTYARHVPASNDNIKIDVNPSDASQFVSGSRLLEALDELKADERHPERVFAALVNADQQIRTVFIESDDDAYQQVFDMVLEVRGQYESDQEELRQTVPSGEIAEMLERCKELEATYRDTVLKDWFHDAHICAQMRAEYISVAKLAQDGNMPGQGALNRKLRTLQRHHAQLSVSEWQSYGQEIGDAFLVLGREGEVNPEIMADPNSGGLSFPPVRSDSGQIESVFEGTPGR